MRLSRTDEGPRASPRAPRRGCSGIPGAPGPGGGSGLFSRFRLHQAPPASSKLLWPGTVRAYKGLRLPRLPGSHGPVRACQGCLRGRSLFRQFSVILSRFFAQGWRRAAMHYPHFRAKPRACGNTLPMPPYKVHAEPVTDGLYPAKPRGLNFEGVRQHATHLSMPGQKLGLVDTEAWSKRHWAASDPCLHEPPVLSSFKMFSRNPYTCFTNTQKRVSMPPLLGGSGGRNPKP